MSKRWILLIAFCFFVVTPTFAEIIHDNFYSASLQENRAIDIYLPPGYHSATDDYPVIYFLHGMSSSPADYSFMLGVILDGLIAAGGIDPVIVALPDGNANFYAGGMYTNSDLYGLHEDYIAFDVVQYVESTYRARGNRANRSVMGHSMGGYGALRQAIRHADLYSAVVALSGFVSVYPFEYWRNRVLDENGGQPPYSYDIENGWFTLATVTAAGAFTPNLDNPPYMVDLPFDANGNPISVVRDLWFQQMPGHLARLDSSVHNLTIYFDCGTQDELGFYPMTEYFHAQLDSQGIAHRFESHNGNHTNQLPARGMLAFMFLDSVRNALSVNENESAVPSELSLLQNYPNPFNAVTNFSFVLPHALHVKLAVYDLSGRDVAVLFDDITAAGSHSFAFNARHLSSGIYFCQLSSGAFSQTRKIVLMK